jgi:hypothetical protein
MHPSLQITHGYSIFGYGKGTWNLSIFKHITEKTESQWALKFIFEKIYCTNFFLNKHLLKKGLKGPTPKIKAAAPSRKITLL